MRSGSMRMVIRFLGLSVGGYWYGRPWYRCESRSMSLAPLSRSNFTTLPWIWTYLYGFSRSRIASATPRLASMFLSLVRPALVLMRMWPSASMYQTGVACTLPDGDWVARTAKSGLSRKVFTWGGIWAAILSLLLRFTDGSIIARLRRRIAGGRLSLLARKTIVD